MVRFNLKWIKLLCLGSMAIISHSAYSVYAEPNQPIPMRQQYSQQGQGLEQNLESLLVEHGVLLNKAILAALHNAPPNVIESGKIRLLKNSREIANHVASVFGPQAGQTFERLFNQHISIGSQYINAVKANNQALANQISNQAIANGREIAKFVNTLNPSTPYATWQNMIDQHNMLEAEQTKAYFQGDFNRANRLRDESLAQLSEMAKLAAFSFQKQPPAQMGSQLVR